MKENIYTFCSSDRKRDDACSLYPWCEKSENVDQDDRCVFKPWERAGDKYLCPYAMLWRHWNLTQYNPHTLN